MMYSEVTVGLSVGVSLFVMSLLQPQSQTYYIAPAKCHPLPLVQLHDSFAKWLAVPSHQQYRGPISSIWYLFTTVEVQNTCTHTLTNSGTRWH